MRYRTGFTFVVKFLDLRSAVGQILQVQEKLMIFKVLGLLGLGSLLPARCQ